MRILIFTFLFISIHSYLNSQIFVKVTDPGNPVVNEVLAGNYIGTSWIDIDNDEFIDLYISRKDIFKNLGNGNFIKLNGSLPLQGLVIGNSWSDYDNDGYIDVFVVASNQNFPAAFLYRNNGNGTFSKILTGPIADSISNTGWGCAWGDYNNDGWNDLIIAAAFGFGGVMHGNRFFHNNGNGSFTRIDTSSLTTVTAPYTIPVWSDHDLDGDADLFIGSGPAGGSLARDYNFKNNLKELNIPYLQRIDTGIIGIDPVDGQNWNWIDYDNDGDLDAYLTNYRNNLVRNKLYKCIQPGYYLSQTSSQAGDIVSDSTGQSLANVWSDTDNDGDIDCFVTKDGGIPSIYYRNNGNGTFTKVTNSGLTNGTGSAYGAAFCDYDNDGDQDIFVTGLQSGSAKGLYRNETQNSNKWINIRCSGAGPQNNLSNKSALGTIVKLKANINGIDTWQMREINSQNSFNSMNALNVHFGLGNASVIDSLIIIWPKGMIQTFTNTVPDKFYKITEGGTLNEVIIGIKKVSNFIPAFYNLLQNFPNPFNPRTNFKFYIANNKSENVKLAVYDVLGREIVVLVNEKLSSGEYEVEFNARNGQGTNLTSGVYFYSLMVDNTVITTRKMLLIK